MARQFGWISNADNIPARWDLRLLGWVLASNVPRPVLPQIFDGREGTRVQDWQAIKLRANVVAVGVECGEERAAMLAAGFGDSLPALVALGELSVRLTRLEGCTSALPRRRHLGPVELDLLHRDARVVDGSHSGRWLALHPREFALLWRLADDPGVQIPRERLLRDVWRLAHVPETNSLEVHISRLRAKLAVAGAAWLVETDPRGGYRLASADSQVGWTALAAFRRVAVIHS